ncbi:hypothetical protein H2200_003381 [Cladophialophora chaetospira]|uniref:EamA domain-containing protein n=1 Tax=Cladophialophora chaetospira TaxID=386627 RepID=A0AA38XHC5_9EURO|nr:hypothetical protein H2200_003381 [Cladophialophora chaetospira]
MSQARKRKTQQEKLPESRIRSQEETKSTERGRGDMEISSIIAAWRRQPLWMVLAVASGACAAFNGVFAKLTTTSLTSTLSATIATFFNLSPSNTIIDLLVRGTFFLLNLLFNALMWALFTGALTRAESTTRVSIINVSANFMITAMLGWMIFGEKLPGTWWAGAGLLACGNVVIGRREEGKKPGGTIGVDETREEAEGLMHGDGEERDLVELDEDLDRRRSGDEHEQRRLRAGQQVDAPI